MQTANVQIVNVNDPEALAAAVRGMSLATIAGLIKRDWIYVYPAARPYWLAMLGLEHIGQPYGADSGRSVVAYFLANAGSWRGPVARAVKAELRRRLKAG